MTVFYLNPSGNIVSSLEGFPILRVLTRLANLLILRNKRKKKKKNNRKRELCPKYELEVTYECRKLGSLGRLFEGQVIFSKVRRIISTLLYIRVKRVVVFPPINLGKSLPLDLHHTVEHGGHVAAYYINYSVENTEASGM